MDLSHEQDLRTALRLAGLSPRKGLGQHFLIDKASLETIVGAANLTQDDTVLEIGPGLGVMTNLLVAIAGEVVSVEADHALAELLTKDAPTNLKVVEQDILEFDFRELPPRYKVVANIPYYLTSKIFRLLMECPNPPSVAVLLIQKEVAERVAASPGATSVLALSVQYYAEVEVQGVVERHKFYPAPKVDSAIVRLTRRTKPVIDADVDRLFRLIKAGFGERRKQLKNSLAGGLNCTVDLIVKLLAEAKIPAQARAQELDWPQWQRLYNAAADHKLL